jgi:YheC/D like ATP-grasp
MKIQWMTGLANEQVCLSPRTLSEYQMVPGRMNLHFGTWNRIVNLIISDHLTDGVMGLPENWKESFTIPDHVPYEFYKNDTDLHLGPLVALIAFSKHDDITIKKLNDHLDYFLYFGEGLLFICAADGIDTEKKTIKGYYYSREDKSNCWKTGMFPYPGAAYNRTKINKYIFDDLALVMDNCIFNSFSNGSFNKWELWKHLSPDPKLQAHLPDTMPLTNLTLLNMMLDRHDCVYLKSAGGTLSEGMMKVYRMRGRDGYLVLHPNDKKGGNGTNRKVLVDPNRINRWVQWMKQKEYIVQQAISMKIYKEMPIDFRVIMQKNKHNEWECTGIFSKYGKKGSITTLFERSGFLLSGTDSFRLAFEMNESQAQNKIDELTNLSHQICKTFDKYGHYADVGIDLMVDQNEKVWILEVNTLDTYHGFPLHLNNRELYEKVIKNPLEYAKFLAGFIDEKMKFIQEIKSDS